MQGPGALAPCEWRTASAGGTALGCPLGGLQNIVDIEGGTAHVEGGRLDRGKLRLNLSGGEAVDPATGELVREAIALNPDVGGCTLIYDGRRTLMASFCPMSFGNLAGIQFRWEPLFMSGLSVCDPAGCAQLTASMVRGWTPPPPSRVARRISRLERRVRVLERKVRRLLRWHRAALRR